MTKDFDKIIDKIYNETLNEPTKSSRVEQIKRYIELYLKHSA